MCLHMYSYPLGYIIIQGKLYLVSLSGGPTQWTTRDSTCSIIVITPTPADDLQRLRDQVWFISPLKPSDKFNQRINVSN